jgi:hypothetical protein
MRIGSAHLPDYDPIALVVLALGIGATALLALGF